MASSGFAFGTDGIIGSFYNIIPELSLDINDAIGNNDIRKAIELQKKANIVIFFVLKNHFSDTIKVRLSWTVICNSTVLKPFYILTEDDSVQIERDLKKLTL